MSAATELEQVERAASCLVDKLSPACLADVKLAIVLGSGLKTFAAGLEDAIEVPFADVSHWPNPAVEGHGGSLVVGAPGAAGSCQERLRRQGQGGRQGWRQGWRQGGCEGEQW